MPVIRFRGTHVAFVVGVFCAMRPGVTIAGQTPAPNPQVTEAQMAAQRSADDAAAVAALADVARQTGGVDLSVYARQMLNRAIKRTLVERAVADPLTATTQSAAQHQVTVVAEKGDVVGRARFYLPLGENADAIMTFAAPLSGGKTTFATSDGLSANASVNGTLKYTLWSKTQPTAGTSIVSTLQSNSAPTIFATQNNLGVIEAWRQAAASGASVSLAANLRDDNGRLAQLFASQSLVSSPERFYAALAQVMPELVSTTWAGYVSPGFESHRHSGDYLEDETFASATFDESVAALTFSGGISRIATWKQQEGDETKTVKTPQFYAGISMRLGQTVDIDDPRSICRPGGEGGSLECFDLPVNAPGTGTLRSITAELRQWSPSQTLGINPKYTYMRVEADGGNGPRVTHTFEVPVYFMRQVKDVNIRAAEFGADLIGGVNVGWRSGAQEGPFVSLFLTKAFGLP